ncbi:protein kinase superfamily protein [Artemisia annua]|uniref:Protein kinase superfamily protein n=1 Tax=Artemisia annua TaxID=35608 RepID=A0A2U1LTE3_ARTAN|nr:protein kinase superfamily protein [Artemisia annua]
MTVFEEVCDDGYMIPTSFDVQKDVLSQPFVVQKELLIQINQIKGVSFLDALVSGRQQRAEDGQLVILAAGNKYRNLQVKLNGSHNVGLNMVALAAQRHVVPFVVLAGIHKVIIYLRVQLFGEFSTGLADGCFADVFRMCGNASVSCLCRTGQLDRRSLTTSIGNEKRDNPLLHPKAASPELSLIGIPGVDMGGVANDVLLLIVANVHCPMYITVSLDVFGGLQYYWCVPEGLHLADEVLSIPSEFILRNVMICDIGELLWLQLNVMIMKLDCGYFSVLMMLAIDVMGTHGYAAPDYIETGHLIAKSDVWSFGIVLYEILTGRRSLERNRPKEDQKLLDWVRRYPIDSKKFGIILDPRLEAKILTAERKIAKLADTCLLRNAKDPPKQEFREN